MYIKSYLQSYKKKLIEGIEKRGSSMPAFSRELYGSYFQTGNRLEFERLYFARREWFTTQALVVLLGTSKTVDDDVSLLLRIMEDLIKEPTWMLPAHASMEHLDGKRYDIDLFAAETAGSIAEVLARMERYVSESIKTDYEKVKQLFFEQWKLRIHEPWERANPCAWWEYGSMNWTSVCCGNVAIAAHYLEQMGYLVHASVVMERVAKSMKCYLSAMGEEGLCAEGVGYYKYGMQYFLAFHELYAKYGNQEVFDLSRLVNYLPNMYLGKGQFVCFSDSEIRHAMPLGILSYLSFCKQENALLPEDFVSGEELILDEKVEVLGGAECHRFAGALRDYLWVKEYGSFLRVRKTRSDTIIYREQMWYLKKGDITFGIKGGHNDEPHNHNDVGSFFCLIDGKEVFSDLGAGAYTKDYFGEKRYEILCNRSQGHNLPLLEGTEQRAGKDFCATEMIATEKYVKFKLGKAYGRNADDLIREISFGDEDKILLKDRSVVPLEECFILKEEPKLVKKEERVFELFVAGCKVIFTGSNEYQVELLNHVAHDGCDVPVWRLMFIGIENEFCVIVQ